MNTLTKVERRLRTYYYYLSDILDQLQDDFPPLLLAVQQAKTEDSIAFAAGECAAHCAIIEKFVSCAHHFSIPIDCLRSESSITAFESLYNSILDNPKALKEKLHAYQSYVRELGIQFQAAHEHAVRREQADKVGLYGAFASGQSVTFYAVRSTLRLQAMAFLISLKEIGLIDPIPV
jgi:hypothetical protein